MPRGRPRLPPQTDEQKMEKVVIKRKSQAAINRRVEQGLNDQDSKKTVWAVLEYAWKRVVESNDKYWHQHLKSCIEIISRDITGQNNSQEQLEKLQKFLDPTPRLPEIPSNDEPEDDEE